MALLKDLIVTGASRFLGDAYFKTIKEGIWNGTRLGKSYVPSQTVYVDANNIIYGSAADQDALTIRNQSTTNKKAWIKYVYSTSNTLLGKLGIGTINSTVTPYWTDSNSKDHIIYHDGNLPTKIASATTADKLASDITLKIGDKSQTFNGGSNTTYSLEDIGAVKKIGDTMTGQLIIDYSKNTTSSPLLIYSGNSTYTRILFHGTTSKTRWGGVGFTAANTLVRWDNNGSKSYQILDTSNSNYTSSYSTDLLTQTKSDTSKYGAKINGKIINLVENSNALYTDNTSNGTNYLFAFTTTTTGYKKYFTHSDFKFNHTSTAKTVTLGNATFTYNSTTGALEITSC